MVNMVVIYWIGSTPFSKKHFPVQKKYGLCPHFLGVTRELVAPSEPVMKTVHISLSTQNILLDTFRSVHSCILSCPVLAKKLPVSLPCCEHSNVEFPGCRPKPFSPPATPAQLSCSETGAVKQTRSVLQVMCTNGHGSSTQRNCHFQYQSIDWRGDFWVGPCPKLPKCVGCNGSGYGCDSNLAWCAMDAMDAMASHPKGSHSSVWKWHTMAYYGQLSHYSTHHTSHSRALTTLW